MCDDFIGSTLQLHSLVQHEASTEDVLSEEVPNGQMESLNPKFVIFFFFYRQTSVYKGS